MFVVLVDVLQCLGQTIVVITQLSEGHTAVIGLTTIMFMFPDRDVTNVAPELRTGTVQAGIFPWWKPRRPGKQGWNES